MSRTLAKTMHLLLCKDLHGNSDCPWYIEEQREGRWEMPCHNSWLLKAERTLKLSGETEESLEELFRRLIGIIGQVSYLKEKHPTLPELIDTILVEATNKATQPLVYASDSNQREQAQGQFQSVESQPSEDIPEF